MHIKSLLVCAAIATLACCRTGHAQFPLLPDEDRIEALHKALLGSSLNDGLIVAVNYRRPGTPVYSNHYQTFLTCLGMLSAYDHKMDPTDLDFVERGLHAAIRYQNEDGTFSDLSGYEDGQDGLQSGYVRSRADADDAEASLFLAATDALYKIDPSRVDTPLIQACEKSLSVLLSCRGSNGIIWDFQTQDGGQYFSDNVEVRFGLDSASDLLTNTDPQRAALYRSIANALADQLPGFYESQQNYVVTLYGDKAHQYTWGSQPYKDESLTVVSALAFLNAFSSSVRTSLWSKLIATYGASLNQGFSNPNLSEEDPTIERVYFAALKAAPASDQSSLLDRLRQRADELLARNRLLADPNQAGLPQPYSFRFGMLIQGLLAENGFLPRQLPSVPFDVQGPPAVPGDLNGDGKVTIADAVQALQIAVGVTQPTADQTAVGDLNGEGKITIADVVKILQFAVGFITHF